MKKNILLLLTFGILANCSNDDDNTSESDALIRNWKLMEGQIIISEMA